jgi:hypothetical protein
VKIEELLRGDHRVSTAKDTGAMREQAVIFYEMSFLKINGELNKYFNLQYCLGVLCILKYNNFQKCC